MADVKPDLASEPINIKIKAADGEETVFKVKKTTKMKKIMDAYASRVGQQRTALRFVHGDKRVEDDDTPDSLGLEDGDQVDALIQQTGGSVAMAVRC